MINSTEPWVEYVLINRPVFFARSSLSYFEYLAFIDFNIIFLGVILYGLTGLLDYIRVTRDIKLRFTRGLLGFPTGSSGDLRVTWVTYGLRG